MTASARCSAAGVFAKNQTPAGKLLVTEHGRDTR
jgi:hypothetical protein